MKKDIEGKKTRSLLIMCFLALVIVLMYSMYIQVQYLDHLNNDIIVLKSNIEILKTQESANTNQISNLAKVNNQMQIQKLTDLIVENCNITPNFSGD